jgi:hypothetical protein
MRMEGAFESAPIVVELQRQPEATTLLTGRGFRWISQFPFNR